MPGVGAVITGAGTTFTKPGAPTLKTFSRDCGVLRDSGFYQNGCITSSSPGGFIAAFTEENDTTNEIRELVYRQVGSQYSLVLRRVFPASGTNAKAYTKIGYTSFQKSDLNADGDAKAVIATPSTNNSFIQDLDVIDTSGVVVIHLKVNGGFAKAVPGGGLDVWFPDTSSGYLHDSITYTGGQWRVTKQVHESETQAQASNGGGFTT